MISPEYVGIILLGAGLIVTFIRNGRSSSRHYGQFEQKVTTVIDVVEDLKVSVKADTKVVSDKIEKVGAEVVAMQVHCAKVSTEHTQKITHLEGEVFEKRSGK